MTVERHYYVSTYCQHEQHSDCRLVCKLCPAPCLCQCHPAAGVPERTDPDARLASAWGELHQGWDRVEAGQPEAEPTTDATAPGLERPGGVVVVVLPEARRFA